MPGAGDRAGFLFAVVLPNRAGLARRIRVAKSATMGEAARRSSHGPASSSGRCPVFSCI